MIGLLIALNTTIVPVGALALRDPSTFHCAYRNSTGQMVGSIAGVTRPDKDAGALISWTSNTARLPAAKDETVYFSDQLDAWVNVQGPGGTFIFKFEMNTGMLSGSSTGSVAIRHDEFRDWQKQQESIAVGFCSYTRA